MRWVSRKMGGESEIREREREMKRERAGAGERE